MYDSAKLDLSYKAYTSMVEKDNVIYYCIGDYKRLLTTLHPINIYYH